MSLILANIVSPLKLLLSHLSNTKWFYALLNCKKLSDHDRLATQNVVKMQNLKVYIVAFLIDLLLKRRDEEEKGSLTMHFYF